MSDFTDTEIGRVKAGLMENFYYSLLRTLIILPIAVVIVPLIPRRYYSGVSFGSGEYFFDLIKTTIVICTVLIGIWYWNVHKVNKKMADNRPHFKKGEFVGRVVVKRGGFLKPCAVTIESVDEGRKEKFNVTKEEFEKMTVNVEVKVIYEQLSGVMLSVEVRM